MTARWGLACLLPVLAAGLALRLPRLSERPFHSDEAVHAAKFGILLETGQYDYDPNEFHGPTLVFATYPFFRPFGPRSLNDATEASFRRVTVFAGALGLLLVGLLARGLGWPAVLSAGLLAAVSPAMVYYSRYYIQETLLNTFVLGALSCGYLAWRADSRRAAVAAGLFAGLAVATKETVAFSFLAAAVALLPAVRGARRRLWLPGLLAMIVAAVVLLSSFGTHLAGPLDYLRSYLVWLRRAGGTDLHQQPWHYYLSTLAYCHRGRGPVWTEGLILGLALVGLLAAARRGRLEAVGVDPALARFLALYTVALIAIYSLVPYKTPWCVLTPLQGLALLAGVGLTVLCRLVRGRIWPVLVALAFVAGAGHLARQAWRLSLDFSTDHRNPWAYAHPVPDVVDLGARVEGLAEASPDGRATVVQVYAPDEYYWPIPWYLRRMTRVGYFVGVPNQPPVPIVIASTDFEETIGQRLSATHAMSGYFGLRPYALYAVWVENDLWREFQRRRASYRAPVPN